MTIQAPAHRERLDLAHLDHLVDAAVAALTANPVRNVRLMIEVDEVG
jgi:hypothetical protein